MTVFWLQENLNLFLKNLNSQFKPDEGWHLWLYAWKFEMVGIQRWFGGGSLQEKPLKACSCWVWIWFCRWIDCRLKRFIRSVIKSILEVFWQDQVEKLTVFRWQFHWWTREAIWIRSRDSTMQRQGHLHAESHLWSITQKCPWRKSEIFWKHKNIRGSSFQLQHQHRFDKVGCQSMKLSAKKRKFFHLVLQKKLLKYRLQVTDSQSSCLKCTMLCKKVLWHLVWV